MRFEHLNAPGSSIAIGGLRPNAVSTPHVHRGRPRQVAAEFRRGVSTARGVAAACGQFESHNQSWERIPIPRGTFLFTLKGFSSVGVGRARDRSTLRYAAVRARVSGSSQAMRVQRPVAFSTPPAAPSAVDYRATASPADLRLRGVSSWTPGHSDRITSRLIEPVPAAYRGTLAI
jgi:hypothetical protein